MNYLKGIWYLGNEQILISDFYMFVSKIPKILEMVDKIKMNVDKQLLVLKMKKSSNLVKCIGNFFSLSKPKVI